MQILSFKSALEYFIKELSSQYPLTEIQSLYFITMDDEFGYSKSHVLSHYNILLSVLEGEKILKIVINLKQNEPIQYILGKSFFCDLPFNVTPSVLIPRPETEELVYLIIAENKTKEKVTILDIGTGSGCIPISLAKNIANATISSIDISEDCLTLARENALLNNVYITFIKADILHDRLQFDSLDIIVSNPPYILESEKAVMQANVLEYEPHLALFVPDNDALLFYKAIIEKAKDWLVDTGLLYFEINERFGKEICSYALQNGYSDAYCIKDIFEKDRFVKITR
jgi:release factor glutamine methyltransferase